ncbi:hypothetical protein BGZ65_001049, partial [Modicella reniformis]
ADLNSKMKRLEVTTGPYLAMEWLNGFPNDIEIDIFLSGRLRFGVVSTSCVQDSFKIKPDDREDCALCLEMQEMR